MGQTNSFLDRVYRGKRQKPIPYSPPKSSAVLCNVHLNFHGDFKSVMLLDSTPQYETWGGDISVIGREVDISLWDLDADVFVGIQSCGKGDRDCCILNVTLKSYFFPYEPVVNTMLQNGIQATVKFVSAAANNNTFNYDVTIQRTHNADCKWDGTCCRKI